MEAYGCPTVIWKLMVALQ